MRKGGKKERGKNAAPELGSAMGYLDVSIRKYFDFPLTPSTSSTSEWGNVNTDCPLLGSAMHTFPHHSKALKKQDWRKRRMQSQET